MEKENEELRTEKDTKVNDLQKDNTELQQQNQKLEEEINMLRKDLDTAVNKAENLKYEEEQNEEFQNDLLEMITEMKKRKNCRKRRASAIQVVYLPVYEILKVTY